LRTTLFLTAVLLGCAAFANSSLPQHRVVFEFPESAGTIRKMQIDLSESKGVWSAQTVSLSADGNKKSTQLVCAKPAEEFNCNHEDGGGGFKLILAPTPRLTIANFSADDADEESKTYLKAPKQGPLVIDGKKVALSTKDAF